MSDSDKTVNSQTVRALLELRDLILSGALAAGARLGELAMVDRLGVSRTPVRAALQQLADEGLLEALPSGGYAVKAFSEAEIHDAIELRGTLEGLAARFAAERGVSPDILAQFKEVLSASEITIAGAKTDPDMMHRYIALNEQFHVLLSEAAQSPLVARQIDRVTRLPFASPNGFVKAQTLSPDMHAILIIAHDQHEAVVEAIEHHEGARAESLMREHARLARRNLRFALDHQAALQQVRGGALILRPKFAENLAS